MQANELVAPVRRAPTRVNIRYKVYPHGRDALPRDPRAGRAGNHRRSEALHLMSLSDNLRRIARERVPTIAVGIDLHGFLVLTQMGGSPGVIFALVAIPEAQRIFSGRGSGKEWQPLLQIGGMIGCRDGNSDLFTISENSDWHILVGGQEKRGVENVGRGVNLCRANPYQDVTRLQP